MFNFKKSLLIPAAAAFIICPSLAMAQPASNNCIDIANNPEWASLQTQLQQEMKNSQNNAALKTAQKLSKICDTVPTLNYIISILYTKLEQPDSAKQAEKYLRKAIANPDKFDIPPQTLETFYNDLCDVTHLTREQVDQMMKERDDMWEMRVKEAAALSSTGDKSHSISKAVMWTGTGIGIAGIATTAVGAYFYAKKPSLTVEECSKNESCNFKLQNDKDLKKKYAGYALLGAGITMTITGAIMAGIGGYYYVRSKPNEIAITDDVSLNWDLGINSWQLGLTF